MATSKDEILRDIKRYIAELNNSGIPIYKAVLFGSWARGKAGEESDVDVVLISDKFTGDRFQDRRRIVPLRRKINTRIEPIPFTQEGFDTAGILVEEISKYGEEIK
jgi:uncharacterized protein